MSVRLGQVFYGTGPRGYAVLAASPLAQGCEGEVADLCGEIGSPSFEGAHSFVLASRPFGNRVLLLRACEGPTDPNGRRTIFFHVLVASAADLAASRLDAFALSGKNVFRSSPPEGPVADLEVESASACAEIPAPPFNASFPAVLRLEKPDMSLVRSVLGSRVNAVSWASFAETAHPSFDLCSVDVYAAIPAGVAVYDAKGLVRAASVPAARSDAAARAARDGEPQKHGVSFALVASLALNAILAVACAVLFFGSGKGKASEPVGLSAPVAGRVGGDGDSTRDGLSAVKSVLDGFSRENVIRDWDERVPKSAYLPWMKNPKSGKEDEKETFDRIEVNVRFVKKLFDVYEGGKKE